MISLFFLNFYTIMLPGEIGIRVLYIFLPLIFLYFILFVKRIKSLKSFEVLFITFYLYLAITFFWANNSILSIKLMVLEFILILIYFYGRTSVVKINNLESFFIFLGKYFIIGGILFYLVGLYAYYYNNLFIAEDRMYFGIMMENFMPRLRGFTESPNTYILFANFFLIYFLEHKMIKYVLITLVSILLSFSTTGMIIASIILLFYIRINLRVISLILVVLALSVLVFIFFIENNQEIMRMIEWRLQRNSSGTGRFELWNFALGLIEQHPIVGYGINQTRDLIANFHKLNSVHNSYIEVFLTGGGIGLFLYLLLISSIFLDAFKIKKYSKIPLLAVIIYIISGLSNNALHSVFLILILIVLYYYINIERKKHAK